MKSKLWYVTKGSVGIVPFTGTDWSIENNILVLEYKDKYTCYPLSSIEYYVHEKEDYDV